MGDRLSRTSYLFTSESVSEGHPDKVCDRISDEIVDLYFREGPKAGVDPWQLRVACETMATTAFGPSRKYKSTISSEMRSQTLSG